MKENQYTALAYRPFALTVEQGAAVAVVGKATVQALELAKAGSGSTLLIQGGAGGVGTLAIQIARNVGAHVITTAQTTQQDTLLRLGSGSSDRFHPGTLLAMKRPDCRHDHALARIFHAGNDRHYFWTI